MKINKPKINYWGAFIPVYTVLIFISIMFLAIFGYPKLLALFGLFLFLCTAIFIILMTLSSNKDK